jgi:hypothetical protein
VLFFKIPFDRYQEIFIAVFLLGLTAAPVFARGTRDDIVAIARKYVTVSEQAIINSNPKLGFQIKLDTAGLIGYAGALVKQGTIDKNPGDAFFAPQFKEIT